MQEQELLKREINDYKIREKESENKILNLKSELTKQGKLVTKLETKEFILKQQLENIQEEIEQEKTHFLNENEDLQSKVHQYENQIEELKSEIEVLKDTSKRRRSTIDEKKNMNSLLNELHGFDDEGTETPENDKDGAKIGLKRRKTGKEEMLDNLTKLMNSKNKPIKKTPGASNKKEIEDLNKKITVLEKRIEGMTKLTSNLQNKLKEEKTKIALKEKNIERKNQEIDNLRQKLLDTTMGYSDMINDLNEQLDNSYEVNRRLKRKLKHSKVGTRIGTFKESILSLIDGSGTKKPQN